MILLPPRSTRTDTLFPLPTLFLSIKEQLRCHSEHLLAVGGATGGRRLISNLPWRSAFLHNPARPERRRHGQDQAYSNHTDGRLRLRRAKSPWEPEDRRAGKERVRTCRCWWSPSHSQKKNTSHNTLATKTTTMRS